MQETQSNEKEGVLPQLTRFPTRKLVGGAKAQQTTYAVLAPNSR